MGGQPESPSNAARGVAAPKPKRISVHCFGFSPEAVFSREPKYVPSGITQASKRWLKTESGNPWTALALAIRTPKARLAQEYTF